jgi:pimeloyl-ACP methyl ester carboxylesterase
LQSQAKGSLHRSSQLTPFSQLNPFIYKVKDEAFKGFKLSVFHETSTKNAKALVFFLPDYAFTAKNFGSLFKQLTADHGARVYSFDRRGFGGSQGIRGQITSDDRAFRDHWDFFDACTFMRGYP